MAGPCPVQVAAWRPPFVVVLYTLVPEGRWRQLGKLVAAGVVALAGLGRVALGAEAPSDVLVGVVIGVTIPRCLVPPFTPTEVFPISYRRAPGRPPGRHRPRAAIRQGLEDQSAWPSPRSRLFGLAGSAGSTLLRITVEGDPPGHLFGKLYARSHLRADRWYKLGRELLYGRLEDEKPFNTVRRLVQQEDYALRPCRDAGLPTPDLTGSWSFTPNANTCWSPSSSMGQWSWARPRSTPRSSTTASIIRKLWHAGLAHRDIKPANLLVRDGRMLLIDVAFIELRPSPWRQAVDLANMMLCPALRSSPEQVYQRAWLQFNTEEIT